MDFELYYDNGSIYSLYPIRYIHKCSNYVRISCIYYTGSLLSLKYLPYNITGLYISCSNNIINKPSKYNGLNYLPVNIRCLYLYIEYFYRNTLYNITLNMPFMIKCVGGIIEPIKIYVLKQYLKQIEKYGDYGSNAMNMDYFKKKCDKYCI